MKFIPLILALAIPSYALGGECNQETLLAKTIYHEARGEGEHGMRLVAEVTINRVNDDRFPDSICSVLKQPGQFQGAQRGKPSQGKGWQTALKVAEEVLEEGAIHTDALYFKASNSSSWFGRPRQIRYKNHSFY